MKYEVLSRARIPRITSATMRPPTEPRRRPSCSSDSLSSQCAPRPLPYGSGDLLAVALVGDAVDLRIADPGMNTEHFLDLVRVDVFAVPDDRILRPACCLEAPTLVHSSETLSSTSPLVDYYTIQMYPTLQGFCYPREPGSHLQTPENREDPIRVGQGPLYCYRHLPDLEAPGFAEALLKRCLPPR